MTSAGTTARPLRADAARNRELLLRAAEDVFSELGLEAGVDEVARRAGVGMGTLYRRFPTKDALIDELAAELFERVLVAAAEAAARLDGTAVETFLWAAAGELVDRSGLLCRLWQTPAPSSEVEALRNLMAHAVLQDQRAGTIRPEVAGSDLSLALWGVQGIVSTSGGAAPEAWRRHLELVLAGLSTAPRPFAAQPVSREQLDAVSELRRH